MGPYNKVCALLTLCLSLASALPVFADSISLFEQVDHHYADNKGVKLHYVSTGSGPVILFVHGFPDFWYSWRHQMAGLAADYKVVAMDNRGYNKSDAPEGVENYAIEKLLADVDAVISDLGVDKVILAGHDWGGVISWRFAMAYPDRVSKLIIANLTHPKGYAAVRANGSDKQKANTKYIENFQKPDAHKRFTAVALAQGVAGRQPAIVKQRYVSAFENSSFDGMLNYYRAFWPTFNGSIEEANPNLDIPVLQFHGLKDTAVDKDGLRDTWNWINADYTLVTVPSANHFVQHDAHKLVTSTMQWWLANHR